MLKKILFNLIPICVFCLISAAILNAVLGDKMTQYSDSKNDVSLITDAARIYSITSNSTGNVVYLGARPELELRLSGVNAVVMGYYGDEIVIKAKNRDAQNDAELYISAEGNTTSIIELHPTGVTFEDAFGKTSWKDDVSSSEVLLSAEILVPQKVYQSVRLREGSGEVVINNLNAVENDFEIGSGSLSFIKDPSFTASSLSLDVNGGSAALKNMSVSEYDISSRLGSMSVSGLSGSGTISLKNSSAKISYSRFEGVELENVGSDPEIYLPPQTVINVDAKIKAGKVDVITDNAIVCLNSTATFPIGVYSDERFDISNESGNIYIKNHSGSDTEEVPLIPSTNNQSLEYTVL